MRGKGIDYFENSRRATLSQRAYGAANPNKWVGYSGDIWGWTASDGRRATVLTASTRRLSPRRPASQRSASLSRCCSNSSPARMLLLMGTRVYGVPARRGPGRE